MSSAVSHPFHADLVWHLYQASFGKDVDLALSAHLPGRSEERAAATLLGKRCEAVILLGPMIPMEEVVALTRDVPVAAMARRLGGISGVDAVRSNDRTGAAMTANHLASLGHRRIAHVDGDMQAGTPERHAGYYEAMIGRGLDFEIRVVFGGIEESNGYMAMMTLFDSGSAPTGILAFNNECVTGVLSAAAMLGCRVPEGLSVVGYDDSRRAVTTRVLLTFLAQTYEALAMVTIDRAMTQTREQSETLEIVIQPELVARESTSQAPDSPEGS